MERYRHFFYDHFVDLGLKELSARYLNMICMAIILAIFLFIADRVTRRIIIKFSETLSKRTKTSFDDLLVSNRAPRRIAHLVPLILTINLFPLVFHDFPHFEKYVLMLLKVYGIILTIWIIRSILNTLESYFKTLPRLKDKPIDSYIQVAMLFIWTIGIASILAILINLSFLKFFTTLGAASAIVLLIFKDTILGFVASIQVAINDSVRIGDWITMEKYGADGSVIEITLNTVKVQNWDMTITIIPTFALISDSYKNWRGMQDSGGRRIKRAILLRAKSIRYLTEADIAKLKSIQLIANYLDTRQKDISAFNEKTHADKTTLINGRNFTNIGIFRKYLQTYIEKHSGINKDMTIMVRQLAPTPEGVPLEIYCFSSDKRWVNYEYIMSDIFDHALAAVSYFDLEVFEYPTKFMESGN
ncbi:MAG: mechanosensitive ion channel family protein [Psychroserpens sp.]|nr:mechanosensitive ion channel family protein [Psychroserpens sp.]